MKTRTKALMAAAAITSTIGLALATPVVNVTAPIVATGTTESSLVAEAAGERPDHGYTDVKLTTEGPSTIFIQDIAYTVGGRNGWHSHPGILALVLISGSIEWFNGNCESKVYKAGDVWTEGSQLHYFRVVGETGIHLMATYIIAQGATPRIDKPAPACAAALGLN